MLTITKKMNTEYLMFKYLWLIVLLPKEVQFGVMGLMALGLYCKKSSTKLRLSKDVYALLLLSTNTIFAFSICYNVAITTHDSTRIFAAINTCLITFVSIAFYNYYKLYPVNVAKVGKYMLKNSIILMLIYMLYIAVGSRGNLSFMPFPLCGTDWLNGVQSLRFSGYMEYTNAVIFYVIQLIPASLYFIGAQYSKFWQIVYLGVMLLIAIGTHSRSGSILIGIIVTVSLIYVFQEKIGYIYKKYRSQIFLVGGIMAIILVAIFRVEIIKQFDDILNARAGSTGTRLYIYTASLHRMITKSPIIGCGIKDILDGTEYPYGSHSTYIGMLYKTGILGGGLYILATVYACHRVFKKRPIGYGIIFHMCVLAIFALAIVEDIDGTDWNIVAQMTFYAIYISNPNNKVYALT